MDLLSSEIDIDPLPQTRGRHSNRASDPHEEDGGDYTYIAVIAVLAIGAIAIMLINRSKGQKEATSTTPKPTKPPRTKPPGSTVVATTEDHSKRVLEEFERAMVIALNELNSKRNKTYRLEMLELLFVWIDRITKVTFVPSDVELLGIIQITEAGDSTYEILTDFTMKDVRVESKYGIYGALQGPACLTDEVPIQTYTLIQDSWKILAQRVEVVLPDEEKMKCYDSCVLVWERTRRTEAIAKRLTQYIELYVHDVFGPGLRVALQEALGHESK